MIELRVDGPPVPSGRPRFRRIGKGVSTYPDPRDRAGKARVVDAWLAAGCPRLGDDDLYAMSMHVVVPRPPTHWLKNGAVSAAGRKVDAPPGDVDNYAKLAADALVTVGAVPDDRRCMVMLLTKAWATSPRESGCTLIDIWAVPRTLAFSSEQRQVASGHGCLARHTQ